MVPVAVPDNKWLERFKLIHWPQLLPRALHRSSPGQNIKSFLRSSATRSSLRTFLLLQPVFFLRSRPTRKPKRRLALLRRERHQLLSDLQPSPSKKNERKRSSHLSYLSRCARPLTDQDVTAPDKNRDVTRLDEMVRQEQDTRWMDL